MRSRLPRCLAAAMLATALVAPPATAQGPQGSTPPAPPAAPRPGQVLTLSQAIDLALRQQPSLRAAEESRRAAEARIPQAEASYYPKVDLSGSLGRSSAFSASANRTVSSNTFAGAIEARQLVSDFGKTSAAVDQARAGLRVSDADLERVRETVVLNVRQSYIGLVQSRRLVRVAEASLERAELNLRSARGFFEVGTKPKSDVTRAEVEVANSRVAQIRARNLVRISEAQLANAVGLDPTTGIDVEDILAYQEAAVDRVALVGEGLANRPELAQVRARLDAARAQLAAARAGYRPDLSINGLAGSAADEPELRERWAISLTLSWNVFQGFFTQNRVREAEALVEVERANYDTLELQVRLDIEQAYITVLEASERIAATDKAVESATENLRLAQGRYDAGVGTILDLTDAQLGLATSEADQIRALADYQLSLAALERAVGRP